MYHALLTNRYLTTRVIPYIAVAAVALCTALVIIVVSVMSGFLDMVRDAGKTLMGDVIVGAPVSGLPHYERFLEALRDRPEVAAATPVVDSLGLLNMPYGGTRFVQVWGVDPATFDEVVEYADALHWTAETAPAGAERQLLAAVFAETWPALRPELSPAQVEAIRENLSPRQEALLDDPALLAMEADAIALRRELFELIDPTRFGAILRALTPEQGRALLAREPRLTDPDLLLAEGLALEREATGEPGIVLGMHVSEANLRTETGGYAPIAGWWMPSWAVTLTMLPISEGGQPLDPVKRIFPVVNEYRSGVFQIDERRVIIPLEVAQRMLALDEASRVDPERRDEFGNPAVIGTYAARATMVLTRAAAGVSPQELKAAVEATYRAVRVETLASGVPDPLPPNNGIDVSIKTWEEQQAAFIAPVEKERDLMRILFSIVYVVCAGLVLVIFWAIVFEKTRDIGILRSVGASRLGILWIFVRYGLIVGVIGAFLGLGLAFLVVDNINLIHRGLGRPAPAWLEATTFGLAGLAFGGLVWCVMRRQVLPVVVASLAVLVLAALGVGMVLHQGFLVWDPKVYYFAEIPNEVDVNSAVGTMIGAVFFSALGALIPASRAADVDPVVALRYE